MRSSSEVISEIKRLREQQNISLSELARQVGVSKSTLSRYEAGQREFPINDIGQYAIALHVSVNELLGINSSNNHPKTIDLNDAFEEPTLFTYQGKEIPEADLDVIKRILESRRGN